MRLLPSPQDILLVDLANDEFSPLIKLLVEATGDFRITRFTLEEVGERSRLKSFPFVAAIFNCEYLSREEVEILTVLSVRIGNCPILVCANQIAVPSYRLIDGIENVVTLQRPFGVERFNDSFSKIVSIKNFRPDSSPRFITDEKVEVVLLDSGKSVRSSIKNYSAGGMFLEFEGLMPNIGETIQVNISSPGGDSLHRTHSYLSGKVVWRRPETDNSPVGVGLQFT